MYLSIQKAEDELEREGEVEACDQEHCTKPTTTTTVTIDAANGVVQAKHYFVVYLIRHFPSIW